MTKKFDLDDIKDLALKSRSDLIDIIHALTKRINTLEGAHSLGWGQWTVNNSSSRNNLEYKTLGYICADCATNLGGVWPKGHVATFHSGVCSSCDKTKQLASPSDWQLGGDGRPRKITAWEWD